MKLGKIQSQIFSDSMIIAFKNDWMLVNDGKPLEFEAKIEKNRLVLSAKLETLDRTKESILDEM